MIIPIQKGNLANIQQKEILNENWSPFQLAMKIAFKQLNMASIPTTRTVAKKDVIVGEELLTPPQPPTKRRSRKCCGGRSKVKERLVTKIKVLQD